MASIVAGSQHSTDYRHSPCYYQAGDPNSTWVPVAPFKREDLDTSVFWLSQNSVEYLQPTSDPFYLADGTEQGFVGIGPNNWVNVMACADQYQICNPVNDVCLPWGGINSLILSEPTKVNGLALSPAQMVTWSRLVLASLASNTHQSVAKLGPGGTTPYLCAGRLRLTSTSTFGPRLARWKHLGWSS